MTLMPPGIYPDKVLGIAPPKYVHPPSIYLSIYLSIFQNHHHQQCDRHSRLGQLNQDLSESVIKVRSDLHSAIERADGLVWQRHARHLRFCPCQHHVKVYAHE